MKVIKRNDYCGTIRKVVNDEKTKVLYIFGTVKDLLKEEVIFPDNTKGNMNKWLLIDKNENIIEFDSKDEIKGYLGL